MNLGNILLFILFLLNSFYGLTQVSGSLDKSFNSEDLGRAQGDGGGEYKIFKFKKDKILISTHFYNGLLLNGILSIDVFDGSIDSTLFVRDNSIRDVHPMAVFPNNNILAIVRYNKPNDTMFFLQRLLPNGKIDSSYNSIFFSGDLYVAKIQLDGKILLGGQNLVLKNKEFGILARLNSDGTIDSSFHIGSYMKYSICDIRDIELQEDEKIWINGFFTNFDSTGRNNLVRLNYDGTVDASCAITNTGFQQIALQPDGKLLGIGGLTNRFNGIEIPGLIRLNLNGTRDSLFPKENTKISSANYFADLVVLSDGKILISGSLNADVRPNSYRFVTNLLCYDSTGKLDSSFIPGYGMTNESYNILVYDNSSIFLTGAFTTYQLNGRNGLVKIDNKGNIDSIFYTGYGFNGEGAYCIINQITPTNNNSYFIGGYFTRYKGFSNNFIIKILSDGQIDTSFISGTNLTSQVDDIIIQSDGKIIVLGFSTHFKYDTVSQIIRLMPSGEIDKSYKLIKRFRLKPDLIKITRDDALLVYVDHCILKLNNQGLIDSSFKICFSQDNEVYAIEIQEDYKILLSGSFSEINSNQVNNFSRLNEDGSIDNSFQTSGTDIGPSTILIQPDNKIVLGGFMNKYNGQACSQIIRLFPDGNIDPSFDLDFRINRFNSKVRPEARLLTDGSFVFTGEYKYLNDGTTRKMIKISGDGNLDSDFYPPITDGDTKILAIAEQKDGKILFGGDFTECNKVGVNRIGRLNNQLSTASIDLKNADIDFQIWPNPSYEKIKIYSKIGDIKKFTLCSIGGKELKISKVNTQTIELDISNFENGVYFLKIHLKDKIISKPIIKMK
jgi:uncharacterized delta-60 repeat protein